MDGVEFADPDGGVGFANKIGALEEDAIEGGVVDELAARGDGVGAAVDEAGEGVV